MNLLGTPRRNIPASDAEPGDVILIATGTGFLYVEEVQRQLDVVRLLGRARPDDTSKRRSSIVCKPDEHVAVLPDVAARDELRQLLSAALDAADLGDAVAMSGDVRLSVKGATYIVPWGDDFHFRDVDADDDVVGDD